MNIFINSNICNDNAFSEEISKNIECNISIRKRLFNFFSRNRYCIFHIIVFIALTAYVIMHWDKCISMQLFSNFNGNNILFIVWIVLIFLIIYEVEAKEIKFKNRKINEQFESAERLNMINNLQNNLGKTDFSSDGGGINAKS